MARRSFSSGFVLGVVVCGLGFPICHWLCSAVEEAELAVCEYKLKRAGRVFNEYREKHRGKFPVGLDELELGQASPDGLGCPKAKRLGTRAYLYVRPRDDAAEDTPIMFCWRHPRLLTLTKRGQIKTWPR